MNKTISIDKKIFYKEIAEKGVRLNEQQKEAVEYLAGPEIVAAAAGSGKSTVIIAKLAYIQHLYPEERTLAISFTKKAVGDLQSRLISDKNVHVATFHSFFYRLLMANGYKSFQVVTDESARTALVNLALKKIRAEDKITVADAIKALAKGSFAGTGKNFLPAYLDILKENRLMDFDSMQYLLLELLKLRPAIAKRIRSYYQYCCIDEAQDISAVQMDIIRQLWTKDSKIMLVGDNRQAIYGFRGSKPGVMAEFAFRYQARHFSLTTNYRSTPAIVSLANSILPGTEPLIAAKEECGLVPEFHMAADAADEANYVVSKVKQLHNEGQSLSSITVLYRSLPAVTTVLEALLEAAIPVVKIGADGLMWNKSPYKELLALHNLAADIKNVRSWKPCLYIFGLEKDLLADTAEMQKDEPETDFLELLSSHPLLSGKQREQLGKFSGWVKVEEDLPLVKMIEELWAALLQEYFQDKDGLLLDEVLANVKPYASINELQTHINKVKRQYAAMQALVRQPNAEYLRIMSIHSSKGLEFTTVFLVGANEGMLPDTVHEDVSLEEENRLAYVAVTRSKEQLYVSYPAASTKAKDKNKPCRYLQQGFNFTAENTAVSL